MYVVLIILIVLAVPGILALRLAAAKRRERRVGSPSTFTATPEDDAAKRRSNR